MPGETKIEWTHIRRPDGSRLRGRSWNPIPDFDGYCVSAEGEIVSCRQGAQRVMRPMAMPSGHLYIMARITGKRTGKKLWVHHAVLTAFGYPRPAGLECRRLDGRPTNNALLNLVWGTRLENLQDRQRHGTEAHGEAKPAHRLTTADVKEIRALYGTASLRALGKRYGVSHTAIRKAALGIKWTQV